MATFFPGGGGHHHGGPVPWCTDGWKFDPDTCRCVPISASGTPAEGAEPQPTCPTDYFWDPVSCECRPLVCPPGTKWSELDGACIPYDVTPGPNPQPQPQPNPQPLPCPDGYTFDLVTSKCVKIQPPPVIVPPIVIGGGSSTPPPGPGDVYADAGDTSNAFISVSKILSGVLGWIGKIVGLLGAIIGLFRSINWGALLKSIADAIRKILATLDRWLKKILKPYLDWAREVRRQILDIYNRFIRPIVVLIESVRRVIRIFQLLHIHVFDKLDRQLALIEGKLLKPIIDILRRVNTLGNWVTFILNDLWKFRRGLLLGSVSANSGGIFNLVAGAPLKNPATVITPVVPPPPPPPFTFNYFSEGVGDTLATLPTQLSVDSPTGNLLACLSTPIEIGEGTPTGDLLKCLRTNAPLEL